MMESVSERNVLKQFKKAGIELGSVKELADVDLELIDKTINGRT